MCLNKCWIECGEKGNLLHGLWECKLVQPLWRTVWRFLKKLKIELPDDPAIPLLGIYLQKTIIWKYSCTPVFITALFTIAKTWEQTKCPLTDEKTKMCYIDIMKYYSTMEKNEIMPWMALEIIILSEVSQKDRQIPYYYHLYVEFKTWHKRTSLWNRNRLTEIENKLLVGKGERWWGKDEFRSLGLADTNYYI